MSTDAVYRRDVLRDGSVWRLVNDLRCYVTDFARFDTALHLDLLQLCDFWQLSVPSLFECTPAAADARDELGLVPQRLLQDFLEGIHRSMRQGAGGGDSVNAEIALRTGRNNNEKRSSLEGNAQRRERHEKATARAKRTSAVLRREPAPAAAAPQAGVAD